VVVVVDFLPVCSPAGLPAVAVAGAAAVEVVANTPASEKVLTNGRI
jgi:predicted nicotinamide N-methyase